MTGGALLKGKLTANDTTTSTGTGLHGYDRRLFTVFQSSIKTIGKENKRILLQPAHTSKHRGRQLKLCCHLL